MQFQGRKTTIGSLSTIHSSLADVRENGQSTLYVFSKNIKGNASEEEAAAALLSLMA